MKKILIFLLLILITGCNIEKIETGDVVKVDYVGTLSSGTIFDTSIESEAKRGNIFIEERSYEPLEFKVGAGQMIKGFDEGIIGMIAGQEKTIEIGPNDAYGPVREDLIQTVTKDIFSSEDQMVIGKPVMFTTTGHGQVPGMIKEINGDNVVIDLNHPLAGKSLTFRIFVKEISKQ